MKSIFFLAAAGSAVLVAAQNLTGEPDCAIPCLSTAIASVCTPASDQGCACASQGAIGQAALTCLLSNCNATGLQQAQTAGAQLCVDYSATATGVASTTASGNSTAVMTTTGSGSSASSTSSSSTAGTTASASATGATATSASASATSSAGAQSLNGGLAAQAGLLGAVLAGVAALL